MPEHFPEVISFSREPVPISKRAVRAQEDATFEVFEHGLRAAVMSQKQQINIHVRGECLEYAAKKEMEFLDWGLEKANGSAAKLAIIAAKATIFARKNNQSHEQSL
jgi:hypothetical protein